MDHSQSLGSIQTGDRSSVRLAASPRLSPLGIKHHNRMRSPSAFSRRGLPSPSKVQVRDDILQQGIQILNTLSRGTETQIIWSKGFSLMKTVIRDTTLPANSVEQLGDWMEDYHEGFARICEDLPVIPLVTFYFDMLYHIYHAVVVMTINEASVKAANTLVPDSSEEASLQADGLLYRAGQFLAIICEGLKTILSDCDTGGHLYRLHLPPLMPDDVPELHSRARLELLIDMLEDSRGGSVSRKMAGNISEVIRLIVSNKAHMESRRILEDNNSAGLSRLGSLLRQSNVATTTVNLCRTIVDLLPPYAKGKEDRSAALDRVFDGPEDGWDKGSAAYRDCLLQMNKLQNSKTALRKGYMELVNLIRKHVNDDRPQGFQAKGLSVDDEDMFLAPKTQSQSHDGEIILYVDQFGLTLSLYGTDGQDEEIEFDLKNISDFCKGKAAGSFYFMNTRHEQRRISISIESSQAEEFEKTMRKYMGETSGGQREGRLAAIDEGALASVSKATNGSDKGKSKAQFRAPISTRTTPAEAGSAEKCGPSIAPGSHGLPLQNDSSEEAPEGSHSKQQSYVSDSQPSKTGQKDDSNQAQIDESQVAKGSSEAIVEGQVIHVTAAGSNLGTAKKAKTNTRKTGSEGVPTRRSSRQRSHSGHDDRNGAASSENHKATSRTETESPTTSLLSEPPSPLLKNQPSRSLAAGKLVHSTDSSEHSEVAKPGQTMAVSAETPQKTISKSLPSSRKTKTFGSKRGRPSRSSAVKNAGDTTDSEAMSETESMLSSRGTARDKPDTLRTTANGDMAPPGSKSSNAKASIPTATTKGKKAPQETLAGSMKLALGSQPSVRSGSTISKTRTPQSRRETSEALSAAALPIEPKPKSSSTARSSRSDKAPTESVMARATTSPPASKRSSNGPEWELAQDRVAFPWDADGEAAASTPRAKRPSRAAAKAANDRIALTPTLSQLDNLIESEDEELKQTVATKKDPASRDSHAGPPTTRGKVVVEVATSRIRSRKLDATSSNQDPVHRPTERQKGKDREEVGTMRTRGSIRTGAGIMADTAKSKPESAKEDDDELTPPPAEIIGPLTDEKVSTDRKRNTSDSRASRAQLSPKPNAGALDADPIDSIEVQDRPSKQTANEMVPTRRPVPISDEDTSDTEVVTTVMKSKYTSTEVAGREGEIDANPAAPQPCGSSSPIANQVQAEEQGASPQAVVSLVKHKAAAETSTVPSRALARQAMSSRLSDVFATGTHVHLTDKGLDTIHIDATTATVKREKQSSQYSKSAAPPPPALAHKSTHSSSPHASLTNVHPEALPSPLFVRHASKITAKYARDAMDPQPTTMLIPPTEDEAVFRGQSEALEGAISLSPAPLVSPILAARRLQLQEPVKSAIKRRRSSEEQQESEDVRQKKKWLQKRESTDQRVEESHLQVIQKLGEFHQAMCERADSLLYASKRHAESVEAKIQQEGRKQLEQYWQGDYDDMQEIRQVDTDADTARATLEQAQAEMYKNLNYLIKVQLAETKDEQARELFMHGEEGGFFY